MNVTKLLIENIKNNIDSLDELGYELFGLIASRNSNIMLYERTKESFNCDSKESLYNEIQSIYANDYDEYDDMCIFDQMLYRTSVDDILNYMPSTEPIYQTELKIVNLICVGTGEYPSNEEEHDILIDVMKSIIMAYRHDKLIKEAKANYEYNKNI